MFVREHGMRHRPRETAGSMSAFSTDITRPDDAEALVRLTTDSYDRGARAFRNAYYPADRSSNRSVMLGLVLFVKYLMSRVRGGGRVLDIGCGPGVHADFIARATGAGVVAIDRADGMLRLVRERFPCLRVARMDARTLAFPGSSFDGILASCVLHHLPPADLPRAFVELGRIARRGCTLYVITRAGSCTGIVESRLDDELQIGPRFVYALTTDRLARYASDSGFRVLRAFTRDDCVHLLAERTADHDERRRARDGDR
jgi:SAM-dependent methyltransferase